MKDRRRFQRWSCSGPCELEIDGTRNPAFVSNLSFNGACVEQLTELPHRGALVKIRLKTQSYETVLKGEVVYIVNELGRERFGLAFSAGWEEKCKALMPFFEESFAEPRTNLVLWPK